MFEHELGNDSLGLGKESSLCTCQECYNGWVHGGTNRDENVAVWRFGVSSIIRNRFQVVH